MKRLLFFLVLFSAESSSAQLNTWRWQNPLPVGNYLRAIQMLSLNTVYVCGDAGTFMRSSDGGQSWDIQPNILKIRSNFNALSFTDERYGMCCGDSGKVIKTTDGGSSWQILKTNTSGKLNSIVVLDNAIAVMVSFGGAILRTSDGGNTWVTIPTEGTLALLSVRMLRPDFLTITGFAGALLLSTDKGLTWHSKKTYIGNSFFNSNFTDDNTGTLIGEYGLIYHTSDGGVSWTKQQLSNGMSITASLNVIDGKDPNILAIAGDYGLLLFSTNGGAAWQQSYLGTSDPVKGLSFIDKFTGTAVGRNGMVLHTSDGGATWTFYPHKAYTDVLHSVAFPRGDTLNGIAVGNNGAILHTSNGGKIWTLGVTEFSGILNGVSFLDASNAIAVGEFGTMIKTTDAGATWSALNSETIQHLYSVSFSTPTSGIAVGDSGLILTTYTAGEFWTRRYTTPVTRREFFTGVSAPDSLHAYICGELLVYKTSDGGVSWNRTSGDSSRGQSISFADSMHGGFVFDDKYGRGYTRSTSDGGVTFDSVYPGTMNNLFGICFSDRQHATVCGAYGYIAHSTDGGRSWFEQISNTGNNLNAVAFGTVHAGNAVGNHGNIMRISSDDKLAVKQLGASGSPKPILDPCYPNPASGTANISFYLPSGGFATIKIYSNDGKEIAVIASGFMQQGEQKTRFDISKFASGSYLIKLDFEGMSVSQKLTVVR